VLKDEYSIPLLTAGAAVLYGVIVWLWVQHNLSRSSFSLSSIWPSSWFFFTYIRSMSETHRLHLSRYWGYEINLVCKQLSPIHTFMTCLCTQEILSFFPSTVQVLWHNFHNQVGEILYFVLVAFIVFPSQKGGKVGLWENVVCVVGRMCAFACMFVPVGGTAISSHVNFLIIWFSQIFI